MLTVHVVGAAIIRENRCLVAQRSATMRLANKWEFPGGKVEPGESPQSALAREIREELNLIISVGPHLGRGTATIGAKLIALDVFAAEVLGGTLSLREHNSVEWAAVDELASYDWAEADIPVMEAVRAHLLARSG